MTNEQTKKDIKLIQSKINSITKKAIREAKYFQYGTLLNQLDNQLNILKSQLN